MAARVPYRSKLPRTREGKQLQRQIEHAVDAVTGTRVSLEAAQRVTLGFVGIFPAAITPPSGWLRLNGAAVDRQEYAALYNAVRGSSAFGPGDGSTTFDLPDFSAWEPAGFNSYIWTV